MVYSLIEVIFQDPNPDIVVLDLNLSCDHVDLLRDVLSYRFLDKRLVSIYQLIFNMYINDI